MLNIFCDGSAKPNPGYGGIGFVVFRKDKLILEGYQYLGEKITNNQAEFTSVVNALSTIVTALDDREVRIHVDSELVYGSTCPINDNRHKTITNIRLKPFYNALQTVIKHFKKVEFVKIGRNDNKLADKLAQIAVDNKKSSIKQWSK